VISDTYGNVLERVSRMRNSAVAHVALPRMADRRVVLHNQLRALASTEAILHKYLAGLAAQAAEGQIPPARGLLLEHFAEAHVRYLGAAMTQMQVQRGLAIANTSWGALNRKCARQLWKWIMQLSRP
jgi:hypothetical protein